MSRLAYTELSKKALQGSKGPTSQSSLREMPENVICFASDRRYSNLPKVHHVAFALLPDSIWLVLQHLQCSHIAQP